MYGKVDDGRMGKKGFPTQSGASVRSAYCSTTHVYALARTHKNLIFFPGRNRQKRKGEIVSAHYPLFLSILFFSPRGAKRHFSIPLVRYEVMILPSPPPFPFPLFPSTLDDSLNFPIKAGRPRNLIVRRWRKRRRETEWGRPPNKR